MDMLDMHEHAQLHISILTDVENKSKKSIS